MAMPDPRKDAPSFRRNIEPITQKLREIVPDGKKEVLEIGSGTGQHAAQFALEFPAWRIQPTDADPENLASIDAWAKDVQADNVKAALELDVTKLPWGLGEEVRFDLLTCFNVIHITPWEVTEALFEGASGFLKPGAQVLLYGPFRIDGKQTSDSNEKFEDWLKSKDQRFGVRDIGEVEAVSTEHGYSLRMLHAMPANNFVAELTRARF